jgi:hypothetical protein
MKKNNDYINAALRAVKATVNRELSTQIVAVCLVHMLPYRKLSV